MKVSYISFLIINNQKHISEHSNCDLHVVVESAGLMLKYGNPSRIGCIGCIGRRLGCCSHLRCSQ